MEERWIQSIPEELPERDPDTDIGTWVEIERLHSQLKMHVSTNKQRGREAVEKYGVILDPSNELRARLALLTDMFIGVLSPERMRYEIQWQKLIAESLEEGIADATATRQEKRLHLPNGRSHPVKPPASREGTSNE